ncbi:MAG: GT4 family glycosyltransferase PelF [Lachnospiraceae bacterium]|nr:GT4 family glycosyltransferase PelF [Lachnospiraceae bacterium]
MKIAMFAEGSYPYVAGGVSGWIQMLTEELKEKDFVIYTLVPTREDGGKFKYQLPSNICEIRESYLNGTEYVEKKKKVRLKNKEKESLWSLLLGENIDWRGVFRFFDETEYSVNDLLMSKDFMELTRQLYIEKYPNCVFTDFLWSIRSLYLPLFRVLMIPIEDADCFHAISTGYAGIMACKAKYLYNKPLILTEHGIYTREREEEIIKADWTQGIYKNLWINYFYMLSQCIYNEADFVISLFQTARQIQTEIGCPKEKTRVISNGVFAREMEKLPARKEDGKINIGAILRIVPIKDVKTMINAYRMAKEEIPSLCLYLMGPTDENEKYYKECLDLVKGFQISDVIFTGRINVKDYLGKMDIIMLTSISEGQPLCLLEAMAAGKPCIATDVGGCKELLYGGEQDYFGRSGIIIPTMNVDKAAEAMILLAQNKTMRQKMGKSGKARVSEFYRNEEVVRKYRNLYDLLA